MRDPEWGVILEELYLNGGYGQIRRSDEDRELDSRDDLRHYTPLEEDDIRDALFSLENSGLLERRETQSDPETVGRHVVQLTRTGFEIAHDRQMNLREDVREDRRTLSQNRINSALALLTLGLLVISYGELLTGLASQDALSGLVATGIAVIIGLAILIFAWLILKLGLINPGFSEHTT